MACPGPTELASKQGLEVGVGILHPEGTKSELELEEEPPVLEIPIGGDGRRSREKEKKGAREREKGRREEKIINADVRRRE